MAHDRPTGSTAHAPLEGELGARRDELLRSGERAREIFAGLSPRQTWWRPAPGRWSAGECCIHLELAGHAYLDDLDKAIVRARKKGQFGTGPFDHGALGNWFVRLMEPPPRWRLPAPRRLRPAPPRDLPLENRPDPLERFLALRGPLTESLHRAAGLDLGAVRAYCPASRLLRFTLGQIFAILTAHERRHLWQAERVCQHPEFPAD